MPGLLRRRYAVTPASLLLAVVMIGSLTGLSGCSEDPEETSASEPTSSASAGTSGSPSVSSTESTEPPGPPDPELPKAPAAKATQAGRQAFAEFVIERWGYALLTNESDALTDLSPPAGPCEGCPKLAAELKKRDKEGWYVDFPGAKVVKVDVAPGGLPGVHVAKATIDVPASESYFEDGELRNENEARKGATFEVRMRLVGKRYVLLAFRVS